MIYDPNPQAGGRFGSDTLIVDLNQDGNRDVVVGAPGKNVSALVSAGQFMIKPGPIVPASTAIITVDDPNPQANGQFGFRVATGDFNHDSSPDLAVSAPGITVDADAGTFEQGRVTVFFGPWNFANTPPYQTMSPLAPIDIFEDPLQRHNKPGTATTGDRFGWRIAAADADDDDHTDLIIGAPWSQVPKLPTGFYFYSGQAYVYFGDPNGATFSRSREIPHPDTDGDGIGPEDDCFWGFDVAGCELKNAGTLLCDDVVIAAYNRDFGGTGPNQGELYVYLDYPVDDTFNVNRSVYLTLLGGVFDNPPDGADFAWEMAVGRYYEDTFCDLLVGSPGGLSVGLGADKGEAHLFRGGSFFGQGNPDNFYFRAPENSLSVLERFGAGLAFLDQDADGRQDEILAAAPLFDYDTACIPPACGEGRAWLITAFVSGPTTLQKIPSQYQTIDDPTPEELHQKHGWGHANVSVGRLNGNARQDAAIGNSRATYSGFSEAGEVRLIVW